MLLILSGFANADFCTVHQQRSFLTVGTFVAIKSGSLTVNEYQVNVFCLRQKLHVKNEPQAMKGLPEAMYVRRRRRRRRRRRHHSVEG